MARPSFVRGRSVSVSNRGSDSVTNISPLTCIIVQDDAGCGYPFEQKTCTHDPEVVGSNPVPGSRTSWPQAAASSAPAARPSRWAHRTSFNQSRPSIVPRTAGTADPKRRRLPVPHTHAGQPGGTRPAPRLTAPGRSRTSRQRKVTTGLTGQNTQHRRSARMSVRCQGMFSAAAPTASEGAVGSWFI